MTSPEAHVPEITLDEDDLTALHIITRGLGLEDGDHNIIVTTEHGSKEFVYVPQDPAATA